MKKARWEEYAREIFAEDAELLIKFFKNDIEERRTFRNENEFLNCISRILEKYCNIMKSAEKDKNGFWFNRMQSIENFSDRRKRKQQLRTIMYILKLINSIKTDLGISESTNVKEFKEFVKSLNESSCFWKKYWQTEVLEVPCRWNPDYFETRDKRREAWYYQYQ